MTITVTPVSNTQTFGSWLATTNRLANLMSQNTVTSDATAGGSVTTGNSFVNGHFGVNTLHVATELRGGNLTSNAVLTVSTNANFTAVLSVGSNVSINSIGISIGNSTVNSTTVSATAIIANSANVNLLTTSNTVTIGNSAYFVANGNFGLGTNTPVVRFEVSGTDAVRVPAGTSAERPAGATGQFRFNTTINSFEGYNGTAWGSVGGGATGGGTDRIFHLNDVVINNNYTIPNNQNAGTFGPVTVADGVVVTVSSNSTWTVV